MTERELQIIEDKNNIPTSWIDFDREWIKEEFIAGVEWADNHPSDETIKQVLRLNNNWIKKGQFIGISLFDYIKEHWNEFISIRLKIQKLDYFFNYLKEI